MKENKIIWVAVLFADTKFAVTLAKFWLNVAGKKGQLSILNIVAINEVTFKPRSLHGEIVRSQNRWIHIEKSSFHQLKFVKQQQSV